MSLLPSWTARRSAGAVLVALSLVSPARVRAQGTGTIVGRVLDSLTGMPLPLVGVQVVGTGVAVPGTQIGATTNMEGRYRLANIPAGTVTVLVKRIGYQARTITGVFLDAGKTLEIDVPMSVAIATMDAITTSVDRNTASAAAALDQRKNAAGLVNTTTRDDIRKSPDGDAAQVLARQPGVTLADGRLPSTRGLDPRFTQTSLNGARVPSSEPERKAVSVDQFPSSLIDEITAAKTFTPDQPGDFGGASINIRTRDFPGQREITYSLGSGLSTTAGAAGVPGAPGAGGEAFAFAGRNRSIPAGVKAAGDLNGTTQADRNQLINSFRNVWQVSERAVPLNTSMGVTLGGNDSILGRRVGYIGAATYSLSHEAHLGEVRSLARAGSSLGSTDEYNRFEGTSGRSSVLMGGILNLSTLVGSSSRVALNTMYNRTADNDARIERGVYEDINAPISIQRLNYVERSVWSSQLAGEHEHPGGNRLQWALTASGVVRLQPDRSEYAYEIQPNAGGERHLWLSSLPEGAVRTFGTLREHAIEASGSYVAEIGTRRHLKTGLLARGVGRRSATNAYGLYSFSISEDMRALSPEVLFGGRFTDPDSSRITLRSLAQGGSYEASDWLAAGYAMFDGVVAERWRVITGARLEYSDVLVDAVNTLGQPSTSNRVFTDVLPAVAATFTPTENQAMRFSLTRTLARPEYRELAGLRTRDVLGGVDLRGNPDLVRTLIDNADVRYEWYPERGAILSAGVFAKRFTNPIEKVFQASNTNSILEASNAESATSVGLELEGRRNLGAFAPALTPYTAFANVTLIRSRIELGDASATSTNSTRAMAGQAPYVINVGLSYATSENAPSATILFNRVGNRIANPGEIPLPDVIELSRNVLDLSLRSPIGSQLTARADMKNLLDAPVESRQGTVVREFYRTGRVFQLGLSWSK